jgi:hypothetical protein
LLQPLVAYALQRARAGEEIRKRRERSLRSMLNALMRSGRRAISLLSDIEISTKVGRPLSHAEIVQRSAKIVNRMVSEMPLWEPERIQDPRLRQAALEYSDAHGEFVVLLTYDVEKARELVDQLEALQRTITRRMDELNWPEVDDWGREACESRLA